MDNVTHSLIGVIIAEAALQAPAVQARVTAVKGLKTAIYLTSIIGSNLPDSDLIMRFFRADAAFSYLLDHRGWTHTLIGLPALACLGLALSAVIARVRGWTSQDRYGLFGLGLLALLFHVIADSWNEYGVHPFAPFSNRWFYGDFIFILEPWLWVIALPHLLTRKRLVKGLGIAGYFLLLILMIRTEVVPPFLIVGFFSISALFGWVFLRVPTEKRWLLSVFGMVLVLGVFHSSSFLARGKVERAFASQRPSEEILQLATSPMPINPLCWRFVSASWDQESKEYLARSGAVSLLPERFTPTQCAEGTAPRGLGEGVAPSSEIRFLNSADVLWRKEYRASVEEMRKLARENCGFQTILRFTRIPFWIRAADGALTVGDLRFDRGQGRASFSTHVVTDRMGRTVDGQCAQWSWESPVNKLFNGT